MREGPEKKGASRRDVIKGLAAMAALTGAVGMHERAKRAANIAEKLVPEESIFDAEAHPRAYDMGKLAGLRVGPQYARYFGTDGHIDSVEHIDFKYQLAKLWQEKYEKMRGDEPREEYDFHHPGILAAMNAIYAGYKPPAPGEGETLAGYRRNVDEALSEVDDVLDWDRLEKRFALKRHQREALERFTGAITADTVLSYALTELMPSENGKINVEAFGFLLKNAGRGYIERIPALGDRRFSFGPFQFTSDALDNFGAPNGASIIDRTFQRSVLPPNVESLRGDDHARAAYVFCLYNLVLLVKDLGDEGSHHVLRDDPAFLDQAIRDYVVAAHHRPVEARRAFHHLLDRRRHRGAASPFAHFCHADVRTYIEKTHENRAALEMALADSQMATR